MPKLKYNDGTGFKQIVPTKDEFDRHLAEIATNKDTATLGQALLSNGDGTSTFKDIKQVSEGGTEGQILQKTISGYSWQDAETFAWKTIADITLENVTSEIIFQNLELENYKIIRVIGLGLHYRKSNSTGYPFCIMLNNNTYKYQVCTVKYGTSSVDYRGDSFDIQIFNTNNVDKRKQIFGQSTLIGTTSNVLLSFNYDETLVIDTIKLVEDTTKSDYYLGQGARFIVMGVK